MSSDSLGSVSVNLRVGGLSMLITQFEVQHPNNQNGVFIDYVNNMSITENISVMDHVTSYV